VEILSRTLLNPNLDSISARTSVIKRALEILFHIHTGFATPVATEDSSLSNAEIKVDALEDAKQRRLLHALLDLISLEGIYPSLSPGVGIPLEKRVISVLPRGVVAKRSPRPQESENSNGQLLRHILAVIVDILFDHRLSIQGIVRSRILGDILSGSADLAFNPQGFRSVDKNKQNKHRSIFEKIIKEYVSPFLRHTPITG
jgi:hypothetical protein